MAESRTVAARDRREEILDVAARLFAERGYQGTSLQDVADEIGFTKAALYYHFTGKDDIVVGLHDRIVAEALDRLAVLLEGGDDPAEALTRALRSHVEILLRHQTANMAFYGELGALPAQLAERVRDRERQYEGILRDLYRRGVAAGRLRDVDPTVAVGTLLAACSWAYRWYRPGGRLGVDRVATMVASLLRDGFEVAPARRHTTRRGGGRDG